MPQLNHISHMIAGEIEPAGSMEVMSPFSQLPIATIDTVDVSGVDQALNIARSLFDDRDCWIALSDRIDILRRTASIMAEKAEQLAVEAAREGGKPLVDSRIEVARAIDGIQICIETLRSEAGDEIPMGANAASQGRLAFTHREPIGVVVAVSAFNHPLNPSLSLSTPILPNIAEFAPNAEKY
ncbi:MAG: aldehyde dehydrogenase family protein [Candidatus Thiodiazotropha sp. (ex Rostrolucina anterorostrata)]|nr:aldehyde dehydrogenase family protein [Candidatus Thiodiazotropha sp. (ex Rostrolucina anterorostrata)]